MGRTTFSGPVASDNGFEGDVTGDVIAADVTATDLTVSGDSSIDGASIIMANLPTSDPSVAGQIWSDSGVLTVSAG